MVNKKLLVLLVVIIAIVVGAGSYFAYSYFSSNGVVEVGDTVKVDYTLKLENGTIVDTSYKQIAEENGIYLESRNYEPLEVIVGSGQVIPGFDSALVRMREGQEKTVTIPPEEAYGEYNSSNVANISRIAEIDRKIVSNISETNVPAEEFSNYFVGNVSVGSIVTATQSGYKFKILNVSDDNITIKAHYEVGDEITIPTTGLKAKVIAVDEDSITWEQQPPEDLDTPFGTADVEVTDDKIILTVNPKIGDETPAGKVVNITDTEIFVDVNHPLAGKTLVFVIKIVDIVKKTA